MDFNSKTSHVWNYPKHFFLQVFSAVESLYRLRTWNRLLGIPFAGSPIEVLNNGLCFLLRCSGGFCEMLLQLLCNLAGHDMFGNLVIPCVWPVSSCVCNVFLCLVSVVNVNVYGKYIQILCTFPQDSVFLSLHWYRWLVSSCYT